MTTSDQWVLLWSHPENEFMAFSLDALVSECRNAYANNSPLPGWHPVVVGSKEDCATTMLACQQTIQARKSEHITMPVMRNFRKIMERTQFSYGLPSGGADQHALHRVLRAPGAQCATPGQGSGQSNAGQYCSVRGGAKPSRGIGWGEDCDEGVTNGEILEVPYLQQADSQTGGAAAPGRHRAKMRSEVSPQAAIGQTETACGAEAGARS